MTSKHTCSPDVQASHGVHTPAGAASSGAMAKQSRQAMPGSALLEASVRCANESRLEELYQLYLRSHHVAPGPGAYQVSFTKHLHCCAALQLMHLVSGT
jgi:hypothetical protein